jgi:hypothetical protein
MTGQGHGGAKVPNLPIEPTQVAPIDPNAMTKQIVSCVPASQPPVLRANFEVIKYVV